MLRQVKGLHGASLHASDGEIGRVDEILFDDAQWTVRYLVVDTGGWLLGRKVLIPPSALGVLDWDRRILNVSLTRDQVERSPAAETDKPVSRQWERDYYDYYLWPYYWGGMGASGVSLYPGALLPAEADGGDGPPQAADEQAKDQEASRDRGDAHLRSTQEVTGYAIGARDGHLGHVQDFIVDDQTWRICYLAVDTRDWWPGKKVLLPPKCIGQTLWPERIVTVDVTRAQVQNAPEWDSREPIRREYEDELSRYYARQRLETLDSTAERADVSGRT